MVSLTDSLGLEMTRLRLLELIDHTLQERAAHKNTLMASSSVFISSWLVSSITHRCYFYTSEAHLGGRGAGPTRSTEASSRHDAPEHMENRSMGRMDGRLLFAALTERDCVTHREEELLVRAEHETLLVPRSGWTGRGRSSSLTTLVTSSTTEQRLSQVKHLTSF